MNNHKTKDTELRWESAAHMGSCAYLDIGGLRSPEVRYEADGTALVPITTVGTTPDTGLVGLQAIAGNGAKLFTSGTVLDGAACAIGQLIVADRVIFVTEGYRTAAAINTALDGSLKGYAALSLQNLKSVARAARRQHPSAFILVLAESDELGGLVANAAASSILGAQAVFPSFSLPTDRAVWKNNFADLYLHESPAALQQQLGDTLEYMRHFIDEWHGELSRPQHPGRDELFQTTRTG